MAADSILIHVDKAKFLELGRVFKAAYRSNAANVIFTLAGGRLRIEFYGGGCELPCEHNFDLVAEMTAKKFSGIIGDHRQEKSTAGQIALTFRPELGEFATPLSGGKAKFHKVQPCVRQPVANSSR